MSTQNAQPEQALTSFIAQSWHRCGKMMQRETWTTPHQAQGLTFASISRRKTALLTIGQAALEDAWEYMDARPCALFILDESVKTSRLSSLAFVPARNFLKNFSTTPKT